MEAMRKKIAEMQAIQKDTDNYNIGDLENEQPKAIFDFANLRQAPKETKRKSKFKAPFELNRTISPYIYMKL